ncbi:hypothetical protein FC98_GL001818 [Lentilactobacillus kisonensis DSM 19906 = JCM 15041]|uniref:Uncharacterized protein n=2 Tax=Lentilactobacillus kisonensis TaxID=481722 RepID=A0A0R1NU87_9LACO|nr:hypothetical protein FC98_GL001818 [Lentilactobacillus kisonensis DSM 19906 = JCM 15041]
MGKKAHLHSLDLSKLCLNHIKHHLTSYHPTYPSIYMIIALKNARFKAAILDANQGLIAVPQTPKQLLRKMVQQFETMSQWEMRQIALYKGIKEYIPYVYGGLSFSPLKTTADGRQNWIATPKIEGMQDHTNLHQIKVWFEGEPSVPVIIPTTQNFLFERKKKAHILQRVHESVLEQRAMAFSTAFQDPYQRYKYSSFREDPLALDKFLTRARMQLAFSYAEFDYTE